MFSTQNHFRRKLTTLFDFDEIRNKIIPWWLNILQNTGKNISILLQVIFVVWILTSSFTFFIRVFKMIQIKGFGWHVLGAIFTDIFGILYPPIYIHLYLSQLRDNKSRYLYNK